MVEPTATESSRPTVLERLDRFSDRFDGHGRQPVVWATAASLAAGAAVAGAGWLFLWRLSDPDAQFTLQFAGTNDRLQQRVLDQGFVFDLADARLAQLWGAVFAVVWGLIGFALFRVFWRHCWSVGPAAQASTVKNISLLPIAAAALAVIEKLVTVAGLRTDGESVRLIVGFAGAISTLAWAKWVLSALTVVSVFAMLVAALSDAMQRKGRPIALDPEPLTIDARADAGRGVPEPAALGVCCSGGGIRAASFALGAMSALERCPNPDGPLIDSMLGSADYLASVSGGGYAAAAWRIAAGATPGEFPAKPILGDPTTFAAKARRFPPTDEPATNLLEHVRERRSFLATGRGGLPLSVLRFAAQTMWHLSLLFASVFVVFWPFGLLMRSWPVDAFRVMHPADAPRYVEFQVGTHQWLPPLILGAIAAALWMVRLGFAPGPQRTRLDLVIAAFLLLGSGAAITLIGLPYLSDIIVDFTPEGVADKFALTGIYAAALTAVWQVAKKYLERSAKYLGGVLLALGMLLFGLFVIDQAVLDRGWLSPAWLFAVVTLAMVAAFMFANPDSWSLHDFYRKRLAGTFATVLNDEGRPLPLAESDAPRMSAYTKALGPKPVVCCAAAREHHTQTGVAALSMTFEPGAVTVWDWASQTAGQSLVAQCDEITHVEYARRLPHGHQGDRLATMMGAAAISGAAVAPSLGRMNLKTTNALLAAFNARLGVWVPNPAKPPPSDPRASERMSAPRLVNMFKEIFAVFGKTDSNVYATDGGHWENLGIVELIRRRCRMIVVIDASGDVPGTYKTVKQAIALAYQECGATVHIDWSQLAVDESGLVANNFAIGEIRYVDGATARLLYVKAAVARDTSVEIQRHAAGDRTFPNYKTSNQLLSDRQLTYLIRLGFEAMNTALETHKAFPVEWLAGPAPQQQAPATTPTVAVGD